jgi:hypothetical protein
VGTPACFFYLSLVLIRAYLSNPGMLCDFNSSLER